MRGAIGLIAVAVLLRVDAARATSCVDGFEVAYYEIVEIVRSEDGATVEAVPGFEFPGRVEVASAAGGQITIGSTADAEYVGGGCDGIVGTYQRQE